MSKIVSNFIFNPETNDTCTCDNCGIVLEGDHFIVNDEEFFCSDCAEDLVKCDFCGRHVIAENTETTAEGDTVCIDCIDDNEDVVRCEECGELVRSYNATYVDYHGYICGSCLDEKYFFCDHCQEYHHDNERNEVFTSCGSEEWCDHCVEYDAYICSECGQAFDDSDLMNENEYGDYICNKCSSQVYIANWIHPDGIQSYSWKPFPIFCNTAEESPVDIDNTLFYGVELEVEGSDNSDHYDDWWANDVMDMLGFFYAKYDGSLGEHGIEFVSHPATLAYWMENSNNLRRTFKYMTENGFTSHNNGDCGLHVHISLEALQNRSPYAVQNMLIIFDRFWEELKKFSRRTEGQLSQWAQRYSCKDSAENAYSTLSGDVKRNYSRYMAVNLKNEHTVEIRMMRGSLNHETFMATIQLMDVIANKAIEIGNDYRRVQSITWAELVESDHVELNNYLIRRGLKSAAVLNSIPYGIENYADSDSSASASNGSGYRMQYGDRVMVKHGRGYMYGLNDDETYYGYVVARPFAEEQSLLVVALDEEIEGITSNCYGIVGNNNGIVIRNCDLKLLETNDGNSVRRNGEQVSFNNDGSSFYPVDATAGVYEIADSMKVEGNTYYLIRNDEIAIWAKEADIAGNVYTKVELPVCLKENFEAHYDVGSIVTVVVEDRIENRDYSSAEYGREYHAHVIENHMGHTRVVFDIDGSIGYGTEPRFVSNHLITAVEAPDVWVEEGNRIRVKQSDVRLAYNGNHSMVAIPAFLELIPETIEATVDNINGTYADFTYEVCGNTVHMWCRTWNATVINA